jgi:hypothetical protein
LVDGSGDDVFCGVTSVHANVCRWIHVSHWHQHVQNIRKALILPPNAVRSNEILVSGCYSLIGIERDLTYKGRLHDRIHQHTLA